MTCIEASNRDTRRRGHYLPDPVDRCFRRIPRRQKNRTVGVAQHFLDTVNGRGPKGKSSRVEWMPGMLTGNAFREKYLEVGLWEVFAR
jgi:hypothetical protein